MSQNIKKISARITKAVARARALGASLVAQGTWGVQHLKSVGWVTEDGIKEVCICGAIALAENPANGKGLLRAIARKYGITVAQAASLSDGFEDYAPGGFRDDEYPKHFTRAEAWYRIGRKWRERADRIEKE